MKHLYEPLIVMAIITVPMLLIGAFIIIGMSESGSTEYYFAMGLACYYLPQLPRMYQDIDWLIKNT